MARTHNFVKWTCFRISGAEPLCFTAGEPILASVHINSAFSNKTIMTAVIVISSIVSSTPYYVSNVSFKRCSEQRTTHTTHDMLPQHQVNITK